MSTDTKQMFTYLVAFVTVIFGVAELLIAGGIIPIAQTQGFLSNLAAGGAQWYLNPIPWVIVLTLVVNFFGFAENWSIDPQNWSIRKFAETWFKYLPMVVLFSQIPWASFLGVSTADIPATNIAITAAIALAIDMITRALKAIGNGSTVAPVATAATAT
jgi:hypothetical protein